MSTPAHSHDAPVKDLLEFAGSNCHAIDFEDVSISAQALDAIKQAAKTLLRRHTPVDLLQRFTVADSISLLTRRLFWEEDSGKLVMCSDLGGKHFCLRIPAEHWGLKAPRLAH